MKKYRKNKSGAFYGLYGVAMTKTWWLSFWTTVHHLKYIKGIVY